MNFNSSSRWVSALAVIFLLCVAARQAEAQSIRIQPAQQTVKAILQQIEKQTDISFVYSNRLSAINQVITLVEPSGDMRHILQQISRQTNLTFTQSGQQMIVQEQHTGTVRGRVQTSDGEPAGYVTISIKGQRSTQTNAQGAFLLEGIESGRYLITASFLGLRTKQDTVRVNAGGISDVPFILDEDAQTLEEVVVNGERVNKFAHKESEYVAKMPLSYLENPQVYTVVTKELMQDQQVVSYKNIMKNVPGVTVLWDNPEGGSVYAMRGFSTTSNMVNGLSGLVLSDTDPAGIETVEVIKGPSATLFGSSLVSYGGLFNRVTKKPFKDFSGQISYTAGSYGLSRFTLDLNSPLNAEKTVLFRLNAAIHDANTFQDFGFTKTKYLAPSFSYTPNDRLSILVQAEFYDRKGTSPYTFFPIESITPTPQNLGIDFNRSFMSNSVSVHSPTNTYYGLVDYKISDKWTSKTSFSMNNTTNDGYWLYMFATTADSASRNITRYDNSTTSSYDLQQNFIGNFNIGRMKNRLMAGLDFYAYSQSPQTSGILFDVIDVINPDPEQYLSLTDANIAQKFEGVIPWVYSKAKQYTYSAYASDVVNFTDRLIVMLSLRADRFDDRGTYDMLTGETTGKYAQTTLSPKFGGVYHLVKDHVTAFANYMDGFQNVNGTDFTQQAFRAQHAKQLEGGFKVNAFDRRLSATISYYDIDVRGVLVTDPEHPGFSIQLDSASQISKGLETEVIANPISGLNLVLGYTYNKSRYTEDNIRPIAAGPEHTINAWASYKFVNAGKTLRGLGLGLGVNHGSVNKSLNSTSGAFSLPAYTTLDASLFYDKAAYRVGLKLDNLTDVLYYNGWATVNRNPPRSFMANFILKF